MNIILQAFIVDQLIKTAAQTATKTDPAKWEQAKRDAKARMGGKHSARAMQLATQLYKKRGGGYSGAKPTSKNNSLKKWTKQEWQWSGENSKEKSAASRLRRAFRLETSKGHLGQLHHEFYLGDKKIGKATTDKFIGTMNPKDEGVRAVKMMEIYPEYRGLGLGRKAYGEMMRRAPEGELLSDYDVSRAARRVWKRLQGNPGYNIEGPRSFGSTVYRGRITPKALVKEKVAGKGVYLPKKKVERLKSTAQGKAKLRAAASKKRKATREGRQYSSHGLAAGTSLKKTAAFPRSVSRMSHTELTKERNKLVKQYYNRSPRKNYTTGGVSGAVLGAAVSKAVLGRGVIPAAAVSGIVGASALDSFKKKRMLNRIRTLSVALKQTSAPIRQAKRVRT